MKTMLIDANHPEETRVVVLDNNQIAEFDFESRAKAPLKGNIYLAKVTRIEPSLQAAFVDYGGNRHGFLPFNEIHPDYYQIPVADKEALMQEVEAEKDPADEETETDNSTNDNEEASVEDMGGDDAQEAQQASKRRNLIRKYKIQEVIKPRQIILIQVLKEERSNKGASVTTYLSLAGRYCVLMPNTARGGGISRRISSASDRKKLKDTVSKLDVPQGMGLIVRTAGSGRTTAEIKRDWKYLTQLWDSVRDKTVVSTAPSLVHEEGNLIRRCIRDIYDSDIEEVLVSGKDSFKEAKDYMKLLSPTHIKKMKEHKDTAPLFRAHQVENQLAAMFSPEVVLPSGGYLVINQTEALVAIDVNSGKSTRKYSVEQTALATNMEAAVEVARQARLRDLAGLLVIDFIDMDEHRNNRSVERKLKESLRHDRARLQVGRISSFGLLEMSRQRLRAGVLEGSTTQCHHCHGTGIIRSTESRALHILRHMEEQVQTLTTNSEKGNLLQFNVPPDVANYLLNHKRQHFGELETATGLQIIINGDAELASMEASVIAPGETQSKKLERAPPAPTGNAHKSNTHKKGGGRNQRPQHNKNKNREERDEQKPPQKSPKNIEQKESASANVDKPKQRRRRNFNKGKRPDGETKEAIKTELKSVEGGTTEGGTTTFAPTSKPRPSRPQPSKTKPAADKPKSSPPSKSPPQKTMPEKSKKKGWWGKKKTAASDTPANTDSEG